MVSITITSNFRSRWRNIQRRPSSITSSTLGLWTQRRHHGIAPHYLDVAGIDLDHHQVLDLRMIGDDFAPRAAGHPDFEHVLGSGVKKAQGQRAR